MIYSFSIFVFIIFCNCASSSPLLLKNDSVVLDKAVIQIKGPNVPEQSGSLNGTYNFQAAQQNFYTVTKQSNNENNSNNFSNIYLPDGYNITTGIGAHKLHLTRKNWNDARKICAREGGHLAVIDSFREDEILQTLRIKHKQDSVWLGLHDLFAQGEWTTVLDRPAGTNGYLNWSDLFKPNPDNYQGKQHCARLTTGGHLIISTIMCAGMLSPTVPSSLRPSSNRARRSGYRYTGSCSSQSCSSSSIFKISIASSLSSSSCCTTRSSSCIGSCTSSSLQWIFESRILQ